MRAEPDAETVIRLLGLEPHPEGGWFRETWRDEGGTAILYLLLDGERSAWHRVHGSAEVWHHYLGSPLDLRTSLDGAGVETSTLGADLEAGERPQLVVPSGVWQSAEPVGGQPPGYTLAGCTVAPPFHFDALEFAPPGWEPGSDT